MHPYIYRTHDGGKTWKLITGGLPDFGPVDTVREDPVRKGLLFAGTETPSGSPSTTEITGSRCSSTCPAPRCATSGSTTTT